MTDNLPQQITRKEIKKFIKQCRESKEYSCCNGHQFNAYECIEERICPYCCPEGFRKGTRQESLQKHKYDIDFCIVMLRQIYDHIHKYKFSTNSDLVLSLSHTLKRMIAHLEVERNCEKNDNENKI